MVNMNVRPLPAPFSTRARIAKMKETKTEVIAASCGLLPKGAARKKVQLASDSGSNRLTSKMIPTLVPVKMRNFHTRAVTIQLGR